MRSLDERLEEIQRRSEKILKARKKRRHQWMAVCVAVTFCVGLYVLRENDGTQNDRVIAQISQAENVSFSAQVNGTPLSQANVQALIQYIDRIPLPGYGLLDSNLEPDVRSEVSEDDYNQEFHASSTADVVSYQIHLQAQDGSVREYTLQGNILTDQSSGGSTILSEKQLQEIMSLLEGE